MIAAKELPSFDSFANAGYSAALAGWDSFDNLADDELRSVEEVQVIVDVVVDNFDLAKDSVRKLHKIKS